MRLEVKIDATPNERRRILGGADITPMVELVSDMLDDVMMLIVEARLAEFNTHTEDTDLADAPLNEPEALSRQPLS